MPDVQVLPDSIRGRSDVLSPALVCSWTDGGRVAWVHVAGELDVATVPELERTLHRPELRARLVVLDLRELAFIDSSGVHAIVDASVRAGKAGRRLVLLRGPPNVDRMFMLSGSSGELTIGDLDAAEPPVKVLLQLADDELASSSATVVRGAAETISIAIETSERTVRTIAVRVRRHANGGRGERIQDLAHSGRSPKME